MVQHAAWERWEPTIGGRFPRQAYQEIVTRSRRIMNYLTIMSHTLTNQPQDQRDPKEGRETEDDSRGWIKALDQALSTLQPTHHTILSTLTLLSNSLISGQSLPALIPLPRPYGLTQRLMSLGSNRQRGA